MMTNFRMCSVYAAIELPVQNDAATDSRSDGHVYQPRPILSCSPTGFSESAGVGIVFQGHSYFENLSQVAYGILPTPPGKKINVAKFSSDRVDRASRADSNATDLLAGILQGFPQHADHKFQPGFI